MANSAERDLMTASHEDEEDDDDEMLTKDEEGDDHDSVFSTDLKDMESNLDLRLSESE